MNIDYKFNFSQKSTLLTNFLDQEKDGLFYIGHASILVQLNKKKFIFDVVHQNPPYNNSWLFFPSQIMDKRLFNVDAVFISHVHQDHYDPKFLKIIQKKKIPIYIVEGRVNFENILKQNKIKFKKIPVGRKIYFDKNIWLTGCLHEHNSIDSSIVISNNKLTIYHGNDNYLTEKNLSPLKKLVGGIDIGCIPFSFIHWYPFLLDGVTEKWRKTEGKRLIKQFLNLGVQTAKILDPKLVIPFGANLVYADNYDSAMNRAVVSPIDFVEYAKKIDSKKKRYLKIFSGGYIISDNGLLKPRYETVSKKKFKAELKKFLINSLSKNNIVTNYKKQIKINLNNIGNFSWIEEKLNKNKKKIKFNLILQDEKIDNNKILINLKNNKAKIINKIDNSLAPYQYFKINSYVFNKWLNQEIRFEEIIGTRRFRLTRVPNKYNLNVNEICTNYL